MSSCCTQTSHIKHTCPVNGKPYPAVPQKTLLHHLKEHFKSRLTQQNYYFCNDPDCEVIYFADDNSLFTQDSLSTQVGQKSHSDNAMLCYCFNITRHAASIDPGLKQFVIEQTRLKQCACDTMNPSGRCCLKDFP